MSPASNLHGMLPTAIAFNLKLLCQRDRTFVKCSIETTKNVKVADVVWGSSPFYARNGNETPYKEAPEIVAEVASSEELMFKKELYFEKGAKEACLCSQEGLMSFYSNRGKIAESLQYPSFPKVIEFN